MDKSRREDIKLFFQVTSRLSDSYSVTGKHVKNAMQDFSGTVLTVNASSTKSALRRLTESSEFLVFVTVAK